MNAGNRPQILSLPERLGGHPSYNGRGVTLAFVDLAFYAHPDLTLPTSRVRAFADVTRDEPRARDFFTPHDMAFHGTMGACCAAGNGYLSGGRYRGLASESGLVLIKIGDEDGAVQGSMIANALRFVEEHPELEVRIVNVSLGVDAEDAAAPEIVKRIESLHRNGIAVVVAAGNKPGAPLGLPASVDVAFSVGGLDDGNTVDVGDDRTWPSSYGVTKSGARKPELLAPASLLPAPMIPGTSVAREAPLLFHLLSAYEEQHTELLFRKAKSGAAAVEPDARSLALVMNALVERMRYRKYIATDYQHVDGTSFAAPIAASVMAQMLEANPSLGPDDLKRGLTATAEPLDGVPREVQGAGVIRARAAVDWARALNTRGAAQRR